MEKWKWINGFEYYFMISDAGRVLSFTRITPIIRKAALDRTGYHAMRLQANFKEMKTMVHRLVAEHFLENPLNLPEVNHKDSNPNNNHVSNLEWITEKDNVKHAMLACYKRTNGRHWKGKITTEDADKIRATFKNPHSALDLSRIYSIDVSAIYGLLRGETWNKHNEKIRIFKRGRKLE